MAFPKIRIFAVGDGSIFLDGVCGILEKERDITIVGRAEGISRAVEKIAHEQPDLILVDEDVLRHDGRSTLAKILSPSRTSRVIALGDAYLPGMLQDLLPHGLRGYVPRHASTREMMSVIYNVSCGALVIPLGASHARGGHALSPPLLSSREREVLMLVADAQSNAQIARRLSITEATVKRHLHNINIKLGAISRLDAVNKAFAAALIGQAPRGRSGVARPELSVVPRTRSAPEQASKSATQP